jgi:hypothetical protein
MAHIKAQVKEPAHIRSQNWLAVQLSFKLCGKVSDGYLLFYTI